MDSFNNRNQPETCIYSGVASMCRCALLPGLVVLRAGDFFGGDELAMLREDFGASNSFFFFSCHVFSLNILFDEINIFCLLHDKFLLRLQIDR